MHDYLGKDVPKLGFGLMRLPRLNGEESPVDMPQVKEMVDLFMQAGFTYFDTAYIYDDSEAAIKEALVDRYPRESYQLATKLPTWKAKSHGDIEAYFNESLRRTGVKYFDYYLLHNIGSINPYAFERFDAWNYLLKRKEEGIIKHLGFSFHDCAQVLDEVLAKHAEVEFVQLQINYADWESSYIQSRACYETALKYQKPIVIMEPVKGGNLVALPPKALAELTSFGSDASVASWGMRFAGSLDDIITVLSGMSNLEQMRDNIATFTQFEPLNIAERTVIDRVVVELGKYRTIPCTSCGYCLDACPNSIAIPAIFDNMNDLTLYGNMESCRFSYFWETKGHKRGLASDCTQCGDCEEVCTQKIGIIKELERAVDIFE